MSLTLKEKFLYHQIHPLKLAADIGCEPISLYYFWRHDLFLGIATHFLPPVVASFLLICYSNLGPYKNSKAGVYLQRHMSRTVEGLRLTGDLIMVFGAWLRLGWLIVAGAALVVVAWTGAPWLSGSN